MGRKIPARKHHGVRDPQRASKQNGLKETVNNPPTGNNKPSKKAAAFAKLIKTTKKGKKIKRQHGIEDKPARDPKNDIPFKQAAKPCTKQLLNESDKDYIKRINRITQQMITEANYGMKHGVSFVRQPGTGVIASQKKTQILANKKGKSTCPASEVKKQMLAKTEEKVSKEPKKEFVREIIAFGEVVKGPPNLNVPPRLSKISQTVFRPGKKDLLLKSMLQNATTNS